MARRAERGIAGRWLPISMGAGAAPLEGQRPADAARRLRRELGRALMSTIEELGSFLAREKAAAHSGQTAAGALAPEAARSVPITAANGVPERR
jgi:hypothetical protein